MGTRGWENGDKGELELLTGSGFGIHGLKFTLRRFSSQLKILVQSSVRVVVRSCRRSCSRAFVQSCSPAVTIFC